MRATFWSLLAACLLTLRPIACINKGQADGDAHPYVGLMVALDAQGAFVMRCSGSLVAPLVFITAAHCLAKAKTVRLWFAGDLTSSGYPNSGWSATGTPYLHPKYTASRWQDYDLGVVVLNPAMYVSAYATLPRASSLSRVTAASFTTVGYGMGLTRMSTTPRLLGINSVATHDHTILLSNQAGVCHGDSGGPTLFYGTHLLAGITDFSIGTECDGTEGAYRLDQPFDARWLCTTFGVCAQ